MSFPEKKITLKVNDDEDDDEDEDEDDEEDEDEDEDDGGVLGVKERTITITITEQQLKRSQKCEAAQCRLDRMMTTMMVMMMIIMMTMVMMMVMMSMMVVMMMIMIDDDEDSQHRADLLAEGCLPPPHTNVKRLKGSKTTTNKHDHYNDDGGDTAHTNGSKTKSEPRSAFSARSSYRSG